MYFFFFWTAFSISRFLGPYAFTLKKYVVISGVAIFHLIIQWVLATLGFGSVVPRKLSSTNVLYIRKKLPNFLWVVREYRWSMIGLESYRNLHFWASDFRIQQVNIFAVILDNKAFSWNIRNKVTKGNVKKWQWKWEAKVHKP